MKDYKGETANDQIQNRRSNDCGDAYLFRLESDDKFYGFVETKLKNKQSQVFKKIRLENFDKSYANAEEISGVTVIFCSTPTKGEMRIVGGYYNATVYRDRHSIDSGRPYNITTTKGNAFIIYEADRKFFINKEFTKGFMNSASHRYLDDDNYIKAILDYVKTYGKPIV